MSRILTVGLLMILTMTSAAAQVSQIPSPAGAASGQPNLTISRDGQVYLSWIERLPEGRFSLRFATREDVGWSTPRIIAEGSNWFVNWADFPSMIVLPDGTLAAHWLVKSSPETFDYDVHIARSFDGGKTWEKPIIPHRDGGRAEHGFVSLFAATDGNLAAVWLDGREMKAGTGHDHGHGEMTLRYVKIRRDGTLTEEAVLDGRVCECCQTAVALTADGPVVVYRDRGSRTQDNQDEIRDISIVRLSAGRWSLPQPVATDNWGLSGCPVNGPAIVAQGRQIAVAWYTAASDAPRVKLAFSNDAGKSFGKPLTIDDGQPIGRVDMLMLDDGSVLVCWLEKVPGGGALRLRRIDRSGKADQAITVAPSGTARSNGFPQMVRHGNEILFAWTAASVNTAAVNLTTK